MAIIYWEPPGNDFFRFFSGNGNDHLVLLKR